MKNQIPKNRLFFIFTILALIIFSEPRLMDGTAFSRDNEPFQPWGYEGGTGPLHWGEMEQDHEKHLMCREGVRQSPINIDQAQGLKIGNLKIHYTETPLLLINNTHTVLLKYMTGSYLKWEHETFQLIQVHFHHPSEHKVNGHAFPLETHLVHKAANNQYVVIAVFAEYGKRNETLQKIWSHIPTAIDEVKAVKNERINASALLPLSKSYYFYNGSLTTPPCTENVTWLLLEDPITVSQDQVAHFQKFIDHNARPIQKLNHRIVVRLK